MQGVTSCPFKKVSMMLFRGEISKRISFAFAVTEDNVYLTLSEKAVHDQNDTDYDDEMRRVYPFYLLMIAPLSADDTCIA